MGSYPREKKGATINQGQTSGVELERNRVKREISAVTARKLAGCRQKTANEDMLWKFEGYKILVG